MFACLDQGLCRLTGPMSDGWMRAFLLLCAAAVCVGLSVAASSAQTARRVKLATLIGALCVAGLASAKCSLSPDRCVCAAADQIALNSNCPSSSILDAIAPLLV